MVIDLERSLRITDKFVLQKPLKSCNIPTTLYFTNVSWHFLWILWRRINNIIYYWYLWENIDTYLLDKSDKKALLSATCLEEVYFTRTFTTGRVNVCTYGALRAIVLNLILTYDSYLIEIWFMVSIYVY